MQDKINEIKNDVEDLTKETESLYKLAIDTMEKNYKRERFTVKCLLGIIAVLLAINGFLAYQFATTTVMETTTDQSGVYNFTDSEGNVVSSDLSLEEMKELVEANSKNKTNNETTR
jgi:hypothetical protein